MMQKDFIKFMRIESFFDDLTTYMSRSPIVTAVLSKDNAVDEFRKLIGSTDRVRLMREQLEKNMHYQRRKFCSWFGQQMRMQN